jgi:hypothetical protein
MMVLNFESPASVNVPIQLPDGLYAGVLTESGSTRTRRVYDAEQMAEWYRESAEDDRDLAEADIAATLEVLPEA